MTEKKDRIMQAGLQLFAEEGYASTSTSKVAAKAKVSEGLIFRHFMSKEGLLNAILEQAMERTKDKMADVVMTSDARSLIKKAIELPFTIPEDQFDMWRLVFALKWQTNNYDGTAIEPIRLALKNAFKSLGYKNPEAESEIILMFWDGVATSVLLHPPTDLKAILNAMKQKYEL